MPQMMQRVMVSLILMGFHKDILLFKPSNAFSDSVCMCVFLFRKELVRT